MLRSRSVARHLPARHQNSQLPARCLRTERSTPRSARDLDDRRFADVLPGRNKRVHVSTARSQTASSETPGILSGMPAREASMADKWTARSNSAANTTASSRGLARAYRITNLWRNPTQRMNYTPWHRRQQSTVSMTSTVVKPPKPLPSHSTARTTRSTSAPKTPRRCARRSPSSSKRLDRSLARHPPHSRPHG